MKSISKSQYVRGLQCHKSLWLYRDSDSKKFRKEPDAAAQARFDAGEKVGEYAQQLFPGGTLIEFDPTDFVGMVSRTRELIDAGEETIYEASFEEHGVFVMVDILHHGSDGWEIYEVKSTSSTKKYHLTDISIQWYVLEKTGLSPVKGAIVHLNSQYARDGDINVHELFTIEDVTIETKKTQSTIPVDLESIKDMLNGDEPDIPIGVHCKNPHECDFKDLYCWEDVPERSVLNLYRRRNNFDLYHDGVVELTDIPDDTNLSGLNEIQIEAEKTQAPVLNKGVIRDFLDKVEYPIFYFDFETFSDPVPRHQGQHPFEQMPFQYSLHIDDGEQITHKEFLADENSDPRREIAAHMVKDLKTSGSIVAYHASFEKGVIKKLAERFDDLKDELLALNERMVDLEDPFKNGGYYHPDFNGSMSIKSVLPALFPDDEELSYKSLEIQNGGVASESFANLHEISDSEERDKIRDDLLAYCELDTLAMVKIMEKVKDLL